MAKTAAALKTYKFTDEGLRWYFAQLRELGRLQTEVRELRAKVSELQGGRGLQSSRPRRSGRPRSSQLRLIQGGKGEA